MSFSGSFSQPFYTGTGTTTLVPWKYPVALNGRGYLLDDRERGLWRHESIPVVREQADTSATPGEATINRQGLWRRSQDSWHRGAGQTYLDRQDSDPARFRSSKGVNPWDRWALSLLFDTTREQSSANTNLLLAVAGSRLFVTDGTAVRYSDDADTFAAMTGATAAWTSITSDGTYAYACDGADIYRWAGTATVVPAAWSTFDADVLGYVKGRLMAGIDNIASNVTAAGTKVDVVTHPNTAFRWVGFAETPGHILMAGFVGQKSLIYKTAITAEGTNLNVGSVAAELPDGEIVRAINGYLGFVTIGTDKGLRFAIPDSNGNLEIGALIELDHAVRCFEGQGRFVWFGWSNYDTTSTGLGRLDLTQLVESAPAYASDLMATAQGEVLSVVTFADRRVFTVSGSGVWVESSTEVASGTLDTGLIGYGIADEKVALFVDVRHRELGGSVSVSLSEDEGSFSSIGSSSVDSTTGSTLLAGEARAENFELRITLADAELTRWTLRSNPTVNSGRRFRVPLLLAHEYATDNGPEPRNPDDEYAELADLRATRQPFAYQEGLLSYSVTLEDFTWIPVNEDANHRRAGTFIAELKEVA